MLTTTIIGNVGAAPTTQVSNGKEFTTFRVAHNETWKDESGQSHTVSIWIDCILNGRPNVVQYLTPGTQVHVSGNTRLRVYSSKKDRCMKAGLTIQVQTIELLGGKRDDVPPRLYDDNGVQHDVSKYYLTDVQNCHLQSQSGTQYVTDEHGWITPVQTQEPEADDNTPATQET